MVRRAVVRQGIEGLKTHDIPHSPIMSIADIFADPHYRERNMILDVPDEKLGMLSQPGVVPKLSLTPAASITRPRRPHRRDPVGTARHVARRDRRAAGRWRGLEPVERG